MAKMNGKKGNIGRELLFIQAEEEGAALINPSAVLSENGSASVHESEEKIIETKAASQELAQSMRSDKQERLLGKGQLPSITK